MQSLKHIKMIYCIFFSHIFNRTNLGLGINRPIWWIDSEDETALNIDSEYLLGDRILVAPVLDEGAVSRDVYLPPGQWTDMVLMQNVTGNEMDFNSLY